MPFNVFMVKQKNGSREQYFRTATDAIREVGWTWLSRASGAGMMVLTAALNDTDTYKPGEDKGLQRSTVADADVRRFVVARRAAEAEADRDRARGVKFKPYTPDEVIARLETQFLDALVDGDDTAQNTAREFLLHFALRTRIALGQEGLNPPFTDYRFTLEASFVGETMHILAARVLNPAPYKVGYACATVGGMRPRFDALVVQPAWAWQVVNAGYSTKTNINEHLIGPRTSVNPVKAHSEVLTRILKPITTARRQEIAQWVADHFPDGDGANPPRRAAIFVRNVEGVGGHTTAQNMRAARFKRILDALHAADIQQLIILGDSCPADWLNHPDGNPHFQMDDDPAQATAFDFSRVWTAEHGLPDGEASTPTQRRGYSEQASVYMALYRTHGMTCVIGNKSGGLDLPAFAGVPTIQLSEMEDGEIFVHHRLGFQSYCSPFWTVVPVTKPVNPDAMTLSDKEKNLLIDAVRRTRGIRTWHLGQLKTGKDAWKTVA